LRLVWSIIINKQRKQKYSINNHPALIKKYCLNIDNMEIKEFDNTEKHEKSPNYEYPKYKRLSMAYVIILRL